MRRRILLADDSVTIQKVIELTFMDEDYEVRAVSNGDDAIKALSEVEPHFVIADVHMPGADGYEVCRRSKERRPDVPVLLLVGTFEPFDEAQARAAGSDSFLKKPFDSQELLQRVGELLSRSAAPAYAAEPAAAQEQEWGGFEIEAEPDPFGGGSELSLEPPPADRWPADEGEQLFRLEEEPAAAPTPAGFGLPLSDTERLGVPEAAAPLVASRAETELRIEGPAPRGLEESHEPQAAAPIPPAAAGAAGIAAATAAVGNGGLSDADVDRIARRVVELLGDKAVRDVAWEVVPDLAELVIKDRLRELESLAENLE